MPHKLVASVGKVPHNLNSMHLVKCQLPNLDSMHHKLKQVTMTDILEEEAENVGDDLDDPAVEEEEGEGIVLQQQQRLPWEGVIEILNTMSFWAGSLDLCKTMHRIKKCGSNRSVAQIKAGFQARVGPRKADDGGTGEGYAGVVEKETLEIEMRNGKGAETQG
ncbi:hypothetical protein LguiA_002169 [Lonicera macranthoides]